MIQFVHALREAAKKYIFCLMAKVPTAVMLKVGLKGLNVKAIKTIFFFFSSGQSTKVFSPPFGLVVKRPIAN